MVTMHGVKPEAVNGLSSVTRGERGEMGNAIITKVTEETNPETQD